METESHHFFSLLVCVCGISSILLHAARGAMAAAAVTLHILPFLVPVRRSSAEPLRSHTAHCRHGGGRGCLRPHAPPTPPHTFLLWQ